MKKIIGTALICVLLIFSLISTGCSNLPKHNNRATLDNIQQITTDMDRDAVKAIMGSPFAYDAEKIDWVQFGYDTLIYSPDDLAIMEYYKNRPKDNFIQNLPGLNQQYQFTDKTWERKYYFGMLNAEYSVADISYTLFKVIYKDYKINRIEAIEYTLGSVGGNTIYLLEN